jgi:AcrR family transcriptional regulator
MDAQPASRRDRNKLKTRVRILDAARHLFTERGVSGTTIEDLADLADVARATFFNYFPSKAAVVDTILAEGDADFYRELDLAMARDISTKALLRAFFMASGQGIQDERDFQLVMIAESEKSLAGIGTDNDRYQVMIGHFKRVADRGIARGDVRTDYPSDLLAEILVGAYATVLRSWRAIPDYDLVDRLGKTAEAMGDFLLPPRARSAHE